MLVCFLFATVDECCRASNENTDSFDTAASLLDLHYSTTNDIFHLKFIINETYLILKYLISHFLVEMFYSPTRTVQI